MDLIVTNGHRDMVVISLLVATLWRPTDSDDRQATRRHGDVCVVTEILEEILKNF